MQGTQFHRMHRFLGPLAEIARLWRPMVQPVRLPWLERVNTIGPHDAGYDATDSPGANQA
jgi:hypothetical protein